MNKMRTRDTQCRWRYTFGTTAVCSIKSITLRAPHVNLPPVINIEDNPLFLLVDNRLLHKQNKAYSHYLRKEHFLVDGPYLSTQLDILYTH